MYAHVPPPSQAAYAKSTHMPVVQSRAHLPLSAAWLVRSDWQPDADAAVCGACGAPFDAGFRRHHCRLSGQVVCARCSAKVASLGWADGGRPVRVSDGAYNALLAIEAAGPPAPGNGGLTRLVSSEPEAAHPVGRAAPAAGTAATAAAATGGFGARLSLLAGARPSSAAGGAAGKAAARPGQTARSGAAAASSASGAAAETLADLHQRGEKLNNLNEKVGELHTEAQSFYDMAKQLRRTSEKQSRWF